MAQDLFTSPAYLGALNQLNPLAGGAMTQAAELQLLNQENERKNLEHQYKQSEQARQQQLQQALPQILQQLDLSSPQAALGDLLQLGLSPQEAVTILKQLAPDIDERTLFNPVTGDTLIERKQGGRVTSLGGFGGGPSQVQQQQPQQGQEGRVQLGGMEQAGEVPMQDQRMAQTGPRLNENPKQMMARVEREEKEEEADSSELAAAREGLIALEGLKEDLEQIPYTGFGAKTAYKTLGAPAETLLGKKEDRGNKFGTASAERLESAGFKLIAPSIQKMKGALSDKDVAFLLQQIPDLTKSKGGNKKIISDLESQFKRFDEMVAAKRSYRDQYGTTKGFQEKWKSYVDKNPLVGK